MNQLFNAAAAINQQFKTYSHLGIVIDIKREDLLHPVVSGNKLRKLKYNVKQAIVDQYDTLLTFGGAFSNHIAATAAAGKIVGIKTIGIIRGEELGLDLEKTMVSNATLAMAHKHGMRFKFVNRTRYREKSSHSFQEELKAEYGRFYNIPEGGTNELAVQGTCEILTDYDRRYYDVIVVAAGTGGTAAGIINSSNPDQEVYVFSALKGDFLKKDIENWVNGKTFQFIDETTFGGYARSTNALVDYMNLRFRESGIPLDPIYTSKMMYGIEHLVQSGVIKGKTRILAIHTGGLQGINGYNLKLAKKGRTSITYENEF
jgi:1-aminocyclopropane-1-carboxylate deaminase